MLDLTKWFQTHLTPEATAWLEEALGRVGTEGKSCIPELFPQFARRIGRDPIGGGRIDTDGISLDLDAWRLCDGAAAALMHKAEISDELIEELFAHGDLEERTQVLRCLALMPVTDAGVRLLGEAQRTNTVTHFEAAVCDSNMAVRALDHGKFPLEDFNRLILKAAFIDTPLARIFGALDKANPELSRMLQGLATEREAAGRTVWSDTDRLIARAPIEGTLARLIGHLEHGADAIRLAAVSGLEDYDHPQCSAFLAERLPREPHEEVRTAIERALAKREGNP